MRILLIICFVFVGLTLSFGQNQNTFLNFKLGMSKSEMLKKYPEAVTSKKIIDPYTGFDFSSITEKYEIKELSTSLNIIVDVFCFLENDKLSIIVVNYHGGTFRLEPVKKWLIKNYGKADDEASYNAYNYIFYNYYWIKKNYIIDLHMIDELAEMDVIYGLKKYLNK